MNGIEKIIQRMEADAKAERDSITAAAQTQAAAIRHDYQVTADTMQQDAQVRRLAEESRCTYLQDYIRAMIDAANLRSLVRTARLHSDPGFLRQVLFDGGSITVDTILSHIGGGIAPLYHATPFREAAEAGEETLHGSSLTVFERACDNAVLAAAGKARSVPFGVEVVLGYLAAKESEWVAVRIIMSGRMAGMTADAIRERLRDQYV